jgi:hypothetical protein
MVISCSSFPCNSSMTVSSQRRSMFILVAICRTDLQKVTFQVVDRLHVLLLVVLRFLLPLLFPVLSLLSVTWHVWFLLFFVECPLRKVNIRSVYIVDYWTYFRPQISSSSSSPSSWEDPDVEYESILLLSLFWPWFWDRSAGQQCGKWWWSDGFRLQTVN